MTINIDTLCPWKLSLTIGGQAYLTCRPKWADVLELGKLEKELKSPDMAVKANLEKSLREGVKRFFAEAVHPIVEQAEYDDLIAAFTACSAYFTEWLKKKQVLAAQAGRNLVEPIETDPKPQASGK